MYGYAITLVNVSIWRSNYKFRINRSGILQLKRMIHTHKGGAMTGWIQAGQDIYYMYELRQYFGWLLNSLFELKAFHFALFHRFHPF